MRRKNDRLSFFRQTAKDSLQVSRRFRVQARERLVEQQELGLVEKRAGQRRPLLEAAGEPAHGLVGPVAQGEQIERRVNPPLEVPQAEKSAGEFQVFAGGELTVEKGGVRNEADLGLRSAGISAQVLAPKEYLALARPT